MEHAGTQWIEAKAIVTAHWPPGKLDHRRFHTAAEVSAALLGYLRHHTVPGPDTYTITSTHDLVRLLDQLGMLALELPRLLTQLATIAQHLNADPTQPHADRHQRPGPDTTDKLCQFLDQACEDAVLLEMRLAHASGCADHLGHTPAHTRPDTHRA